MWLKRIYKIFKVLVITLITLVAVLYVGLYVFLKIPAVQHSIKERATQELESLLQTEVQIGEVGIEPLSRVTLRDVYLADQQGDTLLQANKVMAGIRIPPLLQGELIFTNIHLFGFDIRLSKETPDSPTNFQFLIDAFASDKENSQNPIQVQINSAQLRRGALQYHLKSAPRKAKGVFDANHVVLHNIAASIAIKSLEKENTDITLKRLSAQEQSGLNLKRLSLHLRNNSERAEISPIVVELPHTSLSLENTVVEWGGRVDSLTVIEPSLYTEIHKSKLTLVDIAPLVPALKHYTTPLTLSGELSGTKSHVSVTNLKLQTDNRLELVSSIDVDGLESAETTYIFAQVSKLTTTPRGSLMLLNNFSQQRQGRNEMLEHLGNVSFRGELSGFLSNLVAYGKFKTDLGEINTDILLTRNSQIQGVDCSGRVETPQFDLGSLLGASEQVGNLKLSLQMDGSIPKKGAPYGKLTGAIHEAEVRGYLYRNIALDATLSSSGFNGSVELNDPNGVLRLAGEMDFRDIPKAHLLFSASGIRPHRLNLLSCESDPAISFKSYVNFEGESIDRATGKIVIDSLSVKTATNHFFSPSWVLEANNHQEPQSIRITSNFMNGEITGRYLFRNVRPTIQRMGLSVLPALFQGKPIKTLEATTNQFRYKFSLENLQELFAIFKLPFGFGRAMELEGEMDDREDLFTSRLTVPRFRINNMFFTEGSIVADNRDEQATLSVRATSLSKKGRQTMVALRAAAHNNQLSTRLNWSTNTVSTSCGTLEARTTFTPHQNPLVTFATLVEIMPSSIIVNDTTWRVSPATVLLDSGRVAVTDFEIEHASQFVRIDGVGSDREQDTLSVSLNKMNLDYIFDTANIPNVKFGGDASGDVNISALFTKTPILNTRNLNITNFAFNNALLGDLELLSRWDNKEKGIRFLGKVSQENYEDSWLEGGIFLGKDSIYLDADAHHANISLMAPFIETILQDAKGYASGKVQLYGNFKNLNLVGSALVEQFTFNVDFLRTSYLVHDSIFFTPTSIEVKEATLEDPEGNRGKLRGVINHRHFRNMTYNIALYDVNNMLVYNETELDNPIYYGRVYGTGAGTIRGDEKKSNIDVNMRTEANSTFTFALTDKLVANDYQFISFINRNAEAEQERLRKEARARRQQALEEEDLLAEGSSSSHELNVNLQVDATPEATGQLLIDPSMGDMIKANGTGNIRLVYNTFQDMKLYGSYTLERGSYNFNLQDLITRDFSIKQGSSLVFRGDPMEADLAIDAIYSTTANLSDLDESFAQDKELTRTNVPVQTVLNISGNLQHPDLSFSLELPTLSQDVERRVQSIISSDDMMNRQVIYLLALGRFYTPDYMSGQNNNQLASVASATLSSQLNNLLGQISENWNIGTNIRSDKGDFSDVEFELALSSQLLNNRLLFNGNFGYRDNSTQSNSFVGDFDLEYLLTPGGNLRLKAYNHYNDRNYYIKSALTTQGVGVVFKNDFDNFSDVVDNISGRYKQMQSWWLNLFKKKEEDAELP